MGERDTGNLEKLPSEGDGKPLKVVPTPPSPVKRAEKEAVAILVELNYPDPTLLSQVIRDVAKWSKMAFVMEPSINTKIQIFAPRKMSPAEGYELFLASLSVVGLRAVQTGPVVKIVPVTVSVSA